MSILEGAVPKFGGTPPNFCHFSILPKLGGGGGHPQIIHYRGNTYLKLIKYKINKPLMLWSSKRFLIDLVSQIQLNLQKHPIAHKKKAFLILNVCLTNSNQKNILLIRNLNILWFYVRNLNLKWSLKNSLGRS